MNAARLPASLFTAAIVLVAAIVVTTLAVFAVPAIRRALTPKGSHARPGSCPRVRDVLGRELRRLLLLVPYERWGFVQSHWYRQYKRAIRKAFAAGCEAIKLRAAAPEAVPALPPSGRAPAGWDITPPGGRHASREPRLDETRPQVALVRPYMEVTR